VNLTALTVAAVLVVSCQGVGGPEPTRFECHATTVGLGFWPEGHGPIASINAPEARDPHVEVTVGLDDLEEVFYFDARGEFIRSRADCDESSAPIPGGSVEGGVEERSATTLTCSLDTEAVIWRSGPDQDPPSVAFTASGSTVATVTLTTDGSTLTYRPEACTPGPPPS